MNGNIKVKWFRIKIWWFIFLAFQGFLLVIMVGSLGTTYWVQTMIKNSFIEMDSLDYKKDGYFDGNQFRGSLGLCEDGCEGKYQDLASDWCDIYNRFHDADNPCQYTCEEQDTLFSLCSTYFFLAIGSGVYLLFELGAIIGILVWSAVMLCSLKRVNFFCMNYCCSICSCVFHYIAIIAWFAITEANLSGSCDSFPKDGRLIQMCGTDGPKLGVFLMVFFPFVVVFFAIVATAAYKKKDTDQENFKGQEIQLGPSQPIAIIPPSPLKTVGDPAKYNPVNPPPYYPNSPPQVNPGNPPPYYPVPPQDNPGNPPPWCSGNILQHNPDNPSPYYSGNLPQNNPPLDNPEIPPPYNPSHYPHKDAI